MSNPIAVLLVPVAILLVVASPLAAQQFPEWPVGTYSNGMPALTKVGTSSVRAVRDLDGDGHPECAVHVNDVTTGQQSWRLHSGATGSFVRTLAIHPGADWLEYAFEDVGDLDGDGVIDLVQVRKYAPSTGPPPLAPSARAISGVNGATLWTATVAVLSTAAISNVQIARIGDSDGDGVGEIAILVGPPTFIDLLNGAPATPTRLFFLSGATGAVVHVIVDGLNIVDSIAAAGDSDGDGVTDLVIGASSSAWAGTDSGGAALLSGATYQYLRFWTGSGPGERFGSGVSGAGDVDGDGLDDVIISSSGALLARVFSAADGSVLQSFPLPTAPSPFSVERIVASSGIDWNGDGVPDHVLFTPVARYLVRSGTDFAILADFFNLGRPMGDVNGDGLPEGIFVETSTVPQTVRIVARRGAQPYGSSTGGLALEWIPGAAAPTAGRLRLSGGTPLATVLLAVSLQPASGQTILGLPLLVSPAPEELVLLESPTLDATGAWECALTLEQPALHGVLLHLQAGDFGANPSTSNGLRLLFEESGAL
ncbi:MAG: VCBS repeat-containing protein [Planctomycetota bacterium]